VTKKVVFNFHRVSDETDVSINPFNYLSNIPCSSFQRLIKILRLNASFVGLEDLLYKTSQKNTLRPLLHLTFDDVSSSFAQSVLPLLEKKRIPVTIFPSISNIDRGYSWRDKIYFIISKPELRIFFVEKMKLVFRESLDIDARNIYLISKDPAFNQKILEEQVINDILKDHLDTFKEHVLRFKPYLNWDDLSQLHGHSLVTIGNHGFFHYNYKSLSEDEIIEDIQKSHESIKNRLGIECKHFAVPFGNLNQRVLQILETTLSKLGYETVGWVRSRDNTKPGNSVLKHYIRIDGGRSALINLMKYWKIRLNKTKIVL